MSVSQILLPNGSLPQSVIATGEASLDGAGTAVVAVAGATGRSMALATGISATGVLQVAVANNQLTITSVLGNGDANRLVYWLLIR